MLEVEIGGKKDFGACTGFSPDVTATIKYYEPETEEELAAAHPNQVRTPDRVNITQESHSNKLF